MNVTAKKLLITAAIVLVNLLTKNKKTHIDVPFVILSVTVYPKFTKRRTRVSEKEEL